MSRPEFGDATAKLGGPVKKSLFERQKAEAEAKRLKEEEETAAALKDFVKSFDDEDDDSAFGGGGGSSLSKRHFPPSSGPNSGRGRGSGPGSLGPTPAFSKKRPFDQGPPPRDLRQGAFSYEEPDRGDVRSAFRDDEDEREDLARSRAAEKAAAKPTLQLSSLPPGTSVAVIKTLMPANLTVDGVKFVPSISGERKSTTAIVTMSEGTPAADLDTAVSALQGKYLGWGFCLSISRYLSSAVVKSNLPTGPASTALPFGAKTTHAGPQYSLSRAPPSGQRGFAPPTSYGPGNQRSGGPSQVVVKPPTDLNQLKLIHKTVESVITNGPEFEALLMSRPEVQREEKWAWLWDPKSIGGVYYRWRLWDILTNAQRRIKVGTGRNDGAIQSVFEVGASWLAADTKLPFEYTINIEEIVSNSDYDSSEDDDSGDEGRKRLERLQGGLADSSVPGDNDLAAYLNPLHKAKLLHLLTRLPTTTSRLRRGDVARITAFAISHAGAGADEVVALLTLNIHQPFAYAAAYGIKDPDRMDVDIMDDREKDKEDPSSAKLMGLYLISDILSSSSTSGVRHAWRYRALFEAALRSHNTFAHLGRLEKDLAWGKLRAEKWKRSVTSLLTLWEGWSVFPVQAQEDFVQAFNHPPLTEEEKNAEARNEIERAEKERAKSKWKAVSAEKTAAEVEKGDVDGEAMDEDVDGEAMVDEDIDGEPMAEDEDLDGEAMIEDDSENNSTSERPQEQSQEVHEPVMIAEAKVNAVVESRRRRPKAEDMFAE